MGMSMGNGGGGGGGRRRHQRAHVMAEINVTPMVDVMLVLLIIFMVAAPLLTVGVPIELPKTAATALGLFAAIPAVIAYNRFGHGLNRIEARLNRFADGFHATLSRELELDR